MQGGVINSARSHGSTMDGAAGTNVTSAAGSSMTAGQSQSKAETAGGVVTVVPDPAAGIGKPGPTGVQTLNGSNVVMNSHIPGGAPSDSSGSNSLPPVTVVNNGPGSVTKGNTVVLSATSSTIIQTSSTNAVTSTVIASQPTLNSVPTVTLVRPPMQTSTVTSQSGGHPNMGLTSTVVSVGTTGPVKFESPKTIIQTTAHVAASSVATGATATVKSPTVLQNVRTSIPSTIAAACPGGIRAIAPQVLAPRLTQPQQNAPNIQNIQLPPGKFDALEADSLGACGIVPFASSWCCLLKCETMLPLAE